MLSAHALHADTKLDHLTRVDDTTAIKHPARLGHTLGDADPIDTLLRLVLLGAAHTSGEARLLALALLDAVRAVILARGLSVESVERVIRLVVDALHEVLVEGEEFVLRRRSLLERSGIGLGVGLAANGLGLLGGDGSRRGRGLVAELVELGGDDDGSATLTGIVGVAVDGDVVALSNGTKEFLDLCLDNKRIAAGIENGHLTRSLLEEGLDHLEGRGLTSVGGVLLEGKAKDGDLLANKGVVEALDDSVAETITSVLVHLDDLAPVLGDLWETHSLGKIDKVEDILLEAAATETDTSHQELVTNTGVDTNGAGDLVNISTSLLANSRDGVNAGNTLSKHGVGHKLGQLRGPNVGGQDTLTGDPGVVDLDESLGSPLSGGGRGGTDQNTVGVEEILDSSTGSQELGVGENLEVNTRAVHGELRTC